MELRHLRYFVAAVDAGGVSRGAARLKISQPALSRQIRDLETELGVSLFERRAGGLVLTGEGEDLAVRSRELLSGAESLRERAHALRGGDAGIIRVGVAPLTLLSLLPPFLAHHRRRHPKVDVRLFEDSPGNLWARLERGELSVAISFPGHEGLGSRLLFPVCALVLMSPNHRLARRKALEVDELAGERLLLPGRQFLTRHGSMPHAGEGICDRSWRLKARCRMPSSHWRVLTTELRLCRLIRRSTTENCGALV